MMKKVRSVTPSGKKFLEREKRKMASLHGLNKKDQYEKIIGQWPYIQNSQLRTAELTAATYYDESAANFERLKEETFQLIDK